MLTKSEFFIKYNGKKVEYDGVAPYQCVDLAKTYLDECFGIKPGSWGNAKYYFISFTDPKWAGYKQMNKYFDRIKCDRVLMPNKGDICVFGGEYGHICIATGESTSTYFYSYDQNYNNEKVVRWTRHSYNNLLGILRPKYKCCSTELNIRKNYTQKSECVGTYKKGELVPYTGSEKNGYTQVEKGKWVCSKYLD